MKISIHRVEMLQSDIANISNGAWCLVKRSDGSWKYGAL
jgi:hypothetical protein